jgi:hypothetical protein
MLMADELVASGSTTVTISSGSIMDEVQCTISLALPYNPASSASLARAALL